MLSRYAFSLHNNMQLHIKYLQVVLVTLFLIVTGIALPITADGQRYHFHNLNVDDGLIQSQATCLAQDKSGNLWIGTLGGLSRYDGRNFTSYTVRNGLLHNIIRAVATDAQGRVWIGGPEGISGFDGETFVHFRKQVQTKRNLNNTQQISVVNDTVWWRVQGEVYFIANGKIKYFVTPGREGFITSFLAEPGNVWIAKEREIYHFHNAQWDTLEYDLPPEVVPQNIFHMFRRKDSTIVLSGSFGFYKIKNKKVVICKHRDRPINFIQNISSATEDNNGALWSGAANGAVKIDSYEIHFYNKRNGLTDNYIYDVFRDSEGSIWLASDGQGVFRFSGTQFTGLDESMGLPSAQVMAIASNKKDSLFIGTYDAGVYVYKDKKVTPLFFPSTPVPAITTLCYTADSKLWIGTRGRGLWSYYNGIFHQYTATTHNLPSNFINCLYTDAFGRLWIGFTNRVMVLEDNIFKTADSSNSPVYSFLTIGFDSTLVAAEDGLQLFHAGAMHPFITGTLADSVAVQCLVKRGSELWLGSSDNGVIRYDMGSGTATAINKSNGLRSDFIYNIITDNDSNVWAGTGFGIHKITTDAKGQINVTFYGKAQGITGMESNINSVLKLKDGSIWFGTTEGALHYNPHTRAVTPAPSGIALQSVKISGGTVPDEQWYDSTDKWYNVPYHLRLPYKKNNIAFSFQAITLNGAQQALYRYRMDGLDAPWSDWSTTNTITYSAMPPGNYVLHVQCKSDAITSTPELTYAFEIITPFHKTSWFRFIIFIACILIGILIQYIYNKQKQNRQKLRARLRSEEQGKVRLRTAEDFHDEIGNKLTRINVLASVLKNKVSLTPETLRILNQIEDNTSQLYSGTRDILWSLKPSNDSLFEIINRIFEFGTELFQDTSVQFSASGNNEQWNNIRLDMEMSRNLIMIFKEAMNNALKYSGGSMVTMQVSLKHNSVLHIVLKDNGNGFDTKSATTGNGLTNMHNRAGRLNGKLYIDSGSKGTIISLSFKIPPNR